MNLSQCLSRLLSCQNAGKGLLVRPALAAPLSTGASPAKRFSKRASPKSASVAAGEELNKKAAELPRPCLIPFQPSVANTVHLIGKVGVPVQIESSPDGGYTAASVLVHEKTGEFPQFWIPVIFKGDLAKIAACHLNERDCVYITGQLGGDEPPLKFEDAIASVQVLAHTLSFVRQADPQKKEELPDKEEVASDPSGKKFENMDSLWNDLFDNPQKWWDNRTNKFNAKSPDFKHKDNRVGLWLNTAPDWVSSKLHILKFSKGHGIKKGKVGSAKGKDNVKKSELWNDLVSNPQNWWDSRTNKLNPKFPDFRHKDNRDGLWLSGAPDWVSSKLDGLKFTEGNSKIIPRETSSKSEKENLWKDLVENAKNWWDNRSNKLKPTQPDFKHKDSGEGLWLDSSTPPWVRDKLPLLNPAKKAAAA